MAENKDGQEKTEEPTAKKLDDAKKKGQVARSRELNTMAVTLAGAISLATMSSQSEDGFRGVMANNFSVSREDLYEPVAMLHHLSNAIQDALWMLAPFFLILMVIAILADRKSTRLNSSH